jgi:hypothetical protein
LADVSSADYLEGVAVVDKLVFDFTRSWRVSLLILTEERADSGSKLINLDVFRNCNSDPSNVSWDVCLGHSKEPEIGLFGLDGGGFCPHVVSCIMIKLERG